MSRSSARRGQVEPLAALVAVFALGAGLAVYAGGVDERLPAQSPADPDPTLGSVEQTIGVGGVVEPSRLSAARDAAPPGHELNVTLTTADHRWETGPAPPATARSATARVSVRVEPGRVRPGRLTVRVWS